MKSLKDIKRELLDDPEVQGEYRKQAPEFDMARELIAARSRAGMTQSDVAAAYLDSVTVTAKQDIFERLIGEAYQVIAALAIDCDRFDDPHVIKALDNLAALRIVHDDVLPFPSKGAPG